jgi:hypothetical protein
MSDGGKGSKPRPFSVSQEEYDNRFESIFGKKKKEDNTGVTQNDYQDILSTEDCINIKNK